MLLEYRFEAVLPCLHMNFPLPSDEELRLKALQQFDILDTVSEAAFDRITALAARLFRVPIVLVSLVDHDRQWFKSCYGLDVRQTSRELSFCAHAILSNTVMVVPDATQDARFAANLLVTGEPNIRFYAGAPLRTSDGRNIGSLCVIDTSPRDFSAEEQQTLSDLAVLVMDEMELRFSQQRLLENESRFRALIKSTADIITVVNEQRIIRFKSPSVTAILGYPIAAMLERSVFEFLHPDDHATFDAALQLIIATPSSQELDSLANAPADAPMEFRFRHQDGSWRVLEAIGKNCLADPGIRGIVINSRDITERQHVEERLRLLESVVIHANDTILITKADLMDAPGPEILYVNEAFCRMTGYSAAEAIGQSPRFLQGEETSREVKAELRAALRCHQPKTVELLNYRKDGSPFWAEMSMVPVADKNGHFTHWVSIQRDVSERRQIQETLRAAKDTAECARAAAEAAQAEAEDANKAKSEFLSRVSHELRTPLNAILGFGQLLEMANLPGNDAQNVDQILRGGRHLLALINEVLDIARIESGQLRLSLEEVQVADVCRIALLMMQPIAAQYKVSLLNQQPHCLWKVDADPQRLQQVLLNLLSNAIKYNRLGGTVRLNCQIIERSRLRISVSDEGEGIPFDKQKRLFSPFDRLGMEKKGIEGTGIGLALSHDLTQAMGGTLDFRSAVGQGSEFWVDLPLVQTSLLAIGAPQKLMPLDGLLAPEAVLPTTQVLYIEDNLSNLRLVERILQHRSIELISAPDGYSGLEMAQQYQPALILLDLHLPDLMGDEVLRHLREDRRTQDIPVAMISADATSHQVEALLDAGAQVYLTKPLDVPEFFRTIDQLLAPKLLATADDVSRKPF